MNIESLLGYGAIPEIITPSPAPLISTGFVSLDEALGGGFVKGSIVELYGDEGTSKSTMVLGMLTEDSAYIDTDYNIDTYYAGCLEVPDGVLILQPDEGNAFSVLKDLLELNRHDLIIVDSLVSMTEEDESFDEHTHNTYLMESMREIRSLIKDTVVVFTNQLRYNGRLVTSAGGKSMDIYADVRLKIKKLSSGSRLERLGVTIKYNKFRPLPSSELVLYNMYGEGISKEFDLVTLAVGRGVIEKRGSFYFYKGSNIGQGMLDVISNVKQSNKLKESILRRVVDHDA